MTFAAITAVVFVAVVGVAWAIVTLLETIAEPPHSIGALIRAQWAAIRRVHW